MQNAHASSVTHMSSGAEGGSNSSHQKMPILFIPKSKSAKTHSYCTFSRR